MRLLIVVVNYRTAGLAVDCLTSLCAEIDADHDRVVVVDNGSGDDSVAQLDATITRRTWSPWVRLVALEHNRGFAAGCNAAIGGAFSGREVPAHVLLLNPDTRVRPGAIRALVRFLEHHPEVGIAGSRLEDPDGTPQRSAFRFFTVLGEFEGGARSGPITRILRRHVIAPPVSDTACQTDWVAGASMLVRRQVFERIGLLDEGYFLYFEEVDFCLRAHRAGFSCWYVPESRVVHLVGQSSGITDPKRVRDRRPAYWFESRQRFFRKNFGWRYALAADLAFTAGYLTRCGRRLFEGTSSPEPERFFSDFLRHSAITRWSSP
jgi:N-acetylglucosaminyl-diphospho-decaprenol L-rhamnosyltransferase